MKVYGLKNCDTCRKALKFLQAGGVNVVYQDVRADGLTLEDIRVWLKSVPADILVNRRSTTWKGLSDADKSAIDDLSEIPQLLVQYPTLLKRPVIVDADRVFVGWTEDTIRALSP